MDTTAGLAALPLPLGYDLVILVPEGRYVVTIGSLNARGAEQRPSSANIHRTRREVRGQYPVKDDAPIQEREITLY